MRNKVQILSVLVFFFALSLGAGACVFGSPRLARAASTVNATVRITICGNGIRENSEQCDRMDLAGTTCQILGYTYGSLVCDAACNFQLSSCSNTAPTPSGGGGGGGGGQIYIAPIQTTIIFTGRAYPKSTVTLLKDAAVAATTVADAGANFSISLSGLSGGNYMFSVYSEDAAGNRSSLLTFPVGVTAGTTTKVSSIFIAPTIALDKSQVAKGDNLAIFGQSAPGSAVTIEVNSANELFAQANADAGGAYLYNLDTSPLELGDHTTKSKAALNGEISDYGQVASFTVGTTSVAASKKKGMIGDLNGDGFVNLIDFSIMAYWYKRPNPPAIVDLSGDGQIDLVDFSILAYYWTG